VCNHLGLTAACVVQAGDDSDPFAEADDRDRRRSQEMQRQVANIPAAALVQVHNLALTEFYVLFKCKFILGTFILSVS
jgi:hypothetical protein